MTIEDEILEQLKKTWYRDGFESITFPEGSTNNIIELFIRVSSTHQDVIDPILRAADPIQCLLSPIPYIRDFAKNEVLKSPQTLEKLEREEYACNKLKHPSRETALKALSAINKKSKNQVKLQNVYKCGSLNCEAWHVTSKSTNKTRKQKSARKGIGKRQGFFK